MFALGLPVIVWAAVNPGFPDPAQGIEFAIGFVMVAPLMFWLCFVPVMHWRERYKGRHPYVWGAFLVFETSGWSKLVYWFMHVLPDSKARGLYREEP